jgi:hypothetical protein
VRQCKKCVFRNDYNICEIKNIDIYEVNYDNCWFFRHWDMETYEDLLDKEDKY